MLDGGRVIESCECDGIGQTEGNRAHIAQCDAGALATEWRGENFGWCAEFGERAHGEAELTFPNRATGACCVLYAYGLRDIFRCEVERAQFVRIQVHANLVFRCANNGYAGNAFNLFESACVYFLRRACETAQVAAVRRIAYFRD